MKYKVPNSKFKGYKNKDIEWHKVQTKDQSHNRKKELIKTKIEYKMKNDAHT